MAIIQNNPSKVTNVYHEVKIMYLFEIQSLDKPYKYKSGQFLHFHS